MSQVESSWFETAEWKTRCGRARWQQTFFLVALFGRGWRLLGLGAGSDPGPLHLVQVEGAGQQLARVAVRGRDALATQVQVARTRGEAARRCGELCRAALLGRHRRSSGVRDDPLAVRQRHLLRGQEVRRNLACLHLCERRDQGLLLHLGVGLHEDDGHLVSGSAGDEVLDEESFLFGVEALDDLLAVLGCLLFVDHADAEVSGEAQVFGLVVLAVEVGLGQVLLHGSPVGRLVLRGEGVVAQEEQVDELEVVEVDHAAHLRRQLREPQVPARWSL